MDNKQPPIYTPSQYLNHHRLNELQEIDKELEDRNIATYVHLICPHCNTSYRKKIFRSAKKEGEPNKTWSDTEFYWHLKRKQNNKKQECPYCHKEISQEVRDK